MEEKCYCESHSKEEIYPNEILRKFKVMALSGSNDIHRPEQGEFTSLLKCPRCNSYYLMDIHNSLYPNQETVSIKKYNPKIDEVGLIKIVNCLEGIITDIELDEYSKLRYFISNIISKDRKDDMDINENTN